MSADDPKLTQHRFYNGFLSPMNPSWHQNVQHGSHAILHYILRSIVRSGVNPRVKSVLLFLSAALFNLPPCHICSVLLSH